jgi:superfamily II DNA/RNA helicase
VGWGGAAAAVAAARAGPGAPPDPMMITAPITEQIIVGTDQKIMNIINKGFIPAGALRLVVVDEADEMLAQGRHVTTIVRAITALKVTTARSLGGGGAPGAPPVPLPGPRDVQILLFSASFNCLAPDAPPAPRKAVQTMLDLPPSWTPEAPTVKPGARGAVVIKVRSTDLVPRNVTHFTAILEKRSVAELANAPGTFSPSLSRREELFRQKAAFLTATLREAASVKAIIFVSTNEAAWRLFRLIGSEDCLGAGAVSIVSGKGEDGRPIAADEGRNARELRKLAEGVIKVIVSTPVLERGIDVRGLNLVVNWDVPVH